MPRLAGFLRSTIPLREGEEAWPDTWLNLRSYVGPADEIGNAWSTFASLSDPEFPLYGDARATLMGPHAAAHAAFLERRRKELAEPPAEAQVGEHVLAIPTLAMSDPTILFDDVWAVSHPDFAASIMRWNAHWDPLHAEWEEDQRTRIQKVSDTILFGETREFAQLRAVPDLLASSLDESRLYVLRGRSLDVWDVAEAEKLESFDLDHDCAGLVTAVGAEIWTLDREVGSTGLRLRVYENGLGSEPRIVDLGDIGAGLALPVGSSVCGADLAILDAEGRLLLVETGDTWTRKALIRTGVENGRGLGSLGGPVTTNQGKRLVTFDVSGESPKAMACEFAGEVALLLGTPKGFWAVRPGGRLDRIDLAPFPEIRVELVLEFVEPERRDGESEMDHMLRAAGEKKRAASTATWRLEGEALGETELLERIQRRVLDPAAKRTDLSGKEWQPWVFVTPVGELGWIAFTERVERLQDQLPEDFLVVPDQRGLSAL